jgi:hypothetical protein
MKQIQEFDINIYILRSKINIDNHIRNNDYKKAFLLLILVLERLNDNEKIEFIDYYSEKLSNSIIDISHLDDSRLTC